jgi:hypothetical protein
LYCDGRYTGPYTVRPGGSCSAASLWHSQLLICSKSTEPTAMTEITHVRQGSALHLTAPGYITMMEREALMYWLPLRGSPAAQSRQSAKLFLQSSELELAHPLAAGEGAAHPLAAGEGAPHPLVRGGGHTRLRERGWGESQYRRGDIHCGALNI